MNLSDMRWMASAAVTRPASHTRNTLSSFNWKSRIQPSHVSREIVPNGDGEYHPSPQSFSHLLQAAFLLVMISIIECFLLGVTKSVADRIAVHSWMRRIRMGDELPILIIHSSDFYEITIISAIMRQELRHDRQRFCCVNRELVT